MARRRTRGHNGFMNAPRKVVVPRAVRARVLREAVRDDSKVRVSMNGTRNVGPSSDLRRPKP